MTDKPNGFRPQEPKKPEIVTLNPVADVVDIMSNGALITMVFKLSHLDKRMLPNHHMVLCSVMFDKELAVKIAKTLSQHANRGNVEANIKTHPLPPGMQLPEEKK